MVENEIQDAGPKSNRPKPATIAFLAVICGVLTLLMGAYCLVVAAQGIESDSVFFNLVELLPLGLMVVIFWLTALFRSARKTKR